LATCPSELIWITAPKYRLLLFQSSSPPCCTQRDLLKTQMLPYHSALWVLQWFSLTYPSSPEQGRWVPSWCNLVILNSPCAHKHLGA
jgi:hypothetical protein